MEQTRKPFSEILFTLTIYITFFSHASNSFLKCLYYYVYQTTKNAAITHITYCYSCDVAEIHCKLMNE